MVELYHRFFFEPILNILIFFYNIVPGHDIGIAIILLTLLIKLVLLPFGAQSIKSQKALQDIQPKLEELKRKYKDDKEKLASETMKLYREQKVNPLSSCLPLLIQFPFLIAVYQAFRTGLSTAELTTYSFITNPGHINAIAFGLFDFSKPNIVIAILAGLSQYVQTKMLMTKRPKTADKGAKDEQLMASMNASMQYFMPFLTILIGMQLPAGLSFYWLLTTILTVIQQKFIFSKKTKPAIEIIPPSNTPPSTPSPAEPNQQIASK